jgi:hypothetical protein
MDATAVRRLTCVVLLVASCAVTTFADHDHDDDQSSLLCAPASSAVTPGVVTTQLDNLRLEATVKWLGPANAGSLLVYNGSGSVSGWGILLFGSNDSPPNVISVLAGGVTIVSSPLTLTAGQWQHIQMDRIGQVVTVLLEDVGGDDDHHDRDHGHHHAQTFSFGVIPANPVGGQFTSIEGTNVGTAFNGFIRDANVTTLGTPDVVVESWDFTKGTPFGPLTVFGPAATGINGHTLTTKNVSWAVPNHRN